MEEVAKLGSDPHMGSDLSMTCFYPIFPARIGRAGVGLSMGVGRRNFGSGAVLNSLARGDKATGRIRGGRPAIREHPLKL